MQTKLLAYATVLEGSAWGGVILASSDSAGFVAFSLLHAAAALVASLALTTLLAPGSRRARLSLLPLAFALLFALPLIGIPLILLWLLGVRRLRARHRAATFAEVSVPPFDIHLTTRPRFRFTGAGGMLANARVPVDTRVGALLALSQVPGRIATPLLRRVLACSNEDVRLLAYGLLDAQEKRLNAAIHEALSRYAVGGAERLAAAERLTELYWELVYHGLAVGDVRRHALESCLAYAEEVLAVRPHAEMKLYKARALHALGQLEQAAALYRELDELPPSRVLPYLAELAYDQGDYATARQLIGRLDRLATVPRLAAVVRYWSAA
ncbi:hypothetical protein [Thiobacter aerophilum]|uniref:Tetratricopeptide repeat protein n=1 Tax=Thiobacter aerophilum TaxID=3121275 RepID=A0ABV0EJD5_9BURK